MHIALLSNRNQPLLSCILLPLVTNKVLHLPLPLFRALFSNRNQPLLSRILKPLWVGVAGLCGEFIASPAPTTAGAACKHNVA